jgi:hypothetical protein
MISRDMSLSDGKELHAVAECVSVAAMIIEQSLPPLVEDARVALRRLQEAHS